MTEFGPEKTPERKARERRAAAGLQVLVAAKAFELETMRMTLVMTKGDFDGEEMMNRLWDAEEKLKAELDKARELFTDVCWDRHETGPKTSYNFPEWVRWLQVRRTRRKSEERLAAQGRR